MPKKDERNNYKPVMPKKLMKIIQEKAYKASEIGISARTIFHWKSKNLLFEGHDAEEKNKRQIFSLAEYFWIKTIDKCRNFGLSLDDIQLIKNQLIQTVRSYDNQNDTSVILENLEKDLSDKDDKEIAAEIEGVRKYINHIKNNRNEFEKVLFAVLYNQRPSGLIITKDSANNVKVTINIQSQEFGVNYIGSYLYISFDEIFTDLGLSEIFKHQSILTENERKSIHIIKTIMQSNKASSITVDFSNDSVRKIDVALKKPKSRKEIEEYKRKLGSNLSYKTDMYKGRINLFDFHFAIRMREK